MVRSALKDVSVDSLVGLYRVREMLLLSMDVPVVENIILCGVCGIDVREFEVFGVRVQMLPCLSSMGWVLVSRSCEALSSLGHVDQRLLLVVVGTVVSPSIRQFHLFALQFRLDPFAIGSVADQRKDRADSVHEHRPLSRLSVVQCGLYPSKD